MKTMAGIDFARIADARRKAEEVSGLHFSVWVGETDADARDHAERLHAGLPDPERSVYLVCDTGQRSLEIVTGSGARQTLTDEECVLATVTMKDIARTGDLSEALVLGLDHLGTYALD
ncbi:MAG: DUF5130 family protein [Propionibacteriaceae bacterium]